MGPRAGRQPGGRGAAGKPPRHHQRRAAEQRRGANRTARTERSLPQATPTSLPDNRHQGGAHRVTALPCCHDDAPRSATPRPTRCGRLLSLSTATPYHTHRSTLQVSPKRTSPESCRLTRMEDTRAAALYFQPNRLTKGEHIGKRGKIQSTPRRRRHGPGGWGGVVGREMSLKARDDRWPQGGEQSCGGTRGRARREAMLSRIYVYVCALEDSPSCLFPLY